MTDTEKESSFITIGSIVGTSLTTSYATLANSSGQSLFSIKIMNTSDIPVLISTNASTDHWIVDAFQSDIIDFDGWESGVISAKRGSTAATVGTVYAMGVLKNE